MSLRSGLRSRLLLAAGCSLASGLVSSRARAEEPPPFYAFDGTMRQQMVLQAGLTNAQTFGALQAVERVLMPEGRFDMGRLGGEFNWIWGAAQVPGCLGKDCSEGYRLQTVDLTASNFAASVCTGDPDQLTLCGFYAAAMTTTIASAPGERFTDNMVLGLAGRGLGPVAPLMLGLGGTEYRKGLTSVQTSAILGVNVSSEWLSGRVGYLAATGDRGLYTDLSVDKIRAFVTLALTEQFSEVGALLAGVRQLGQDIKDAPGTLTAYVRSLRQLPPQNIEPANDYQLPDVADQLGAFQFLTAHLEPKDIGKLVDVDTAYLIRPTPQLYNAIVRLHTPGYGRTVPGGEAMPQLAIGGGLVQLPALPAFGLRESRNVHFHLDVGGSMGSFASLMRLQVNDPDHLATFPFARNAWSFYYYLTVGQDLL